MIPDPRTPYAVEADRAYERGEWLFVEIARQRGAELAMRPPEEWELERVPPDPFGLLSWLPRLPDVTWTFADLPPYAAGDTVNTSEGAWRVLNVNYETRTVTVTSEPPQFYGINRNSESRFFALSYSSGLPRRRAKPSRVPERFQRRRLDGRRS